MKRRQLFLLACVGILLGGCQLSSLDYSSEEAQELNGTTEIEMEKFRDIGVKYFAYNETGEKTPYYFDFPITGIDESIDKPRKVGEGILDFRFLDGTSNTKEYDLFSTPCRNYNSSSLYKTVNEEELQMHGLRVIGHLSTGEKIYTEKMSEKMRTRLSAMKPDRVLITLMRDKGGITADAYKRYLNRMDQENAVDVMSPQEFIDAFPVLVARDPMGNFIMFTRAEFIWQVEACDE